jgi:hypothetical protein
MKAYKTYLTIRDPKAIVINDVPFRPGQRVEVVILLQDDERKDQAGRLKALIKETKELPQIQRLSEEDILAEVAAYRGGR